jgi:hypothetical protein
MYEERSLWAQWRSGARYQVTVSRVDGSILFLYSSDDVRIDPERMGIEVQDIFFRRKVAIGGHISWLIEPVPAVGCSVIGDNREGPFWILKPDAEEPHLVLSQEVGTGPQLKIVITDANPHFVTYQGPHQIQLVGGHLKGLEELYLFLDPSVVIGKRYDGRHLGNATWIGKSLGELLTETTGSLPLTYDRL